MDNKDWRLGAVNKEKLQNAVVCKQEFHSKAVGDHAHCEFCFDTISEYDNDLHEGYFIVGTNSWICENCFRDFSAQFNLTVKDS